MDFTFNRHQRMSSKMRELILDFIGEIRVAGYKSADLKQKANHLKNNLFGLFDGYYYSINLELLEELSPILEPATYYALKGILLECKSWEPQVTETTEIF